MKKDVVGFSKEDCKFYVDKNARKVVCVAHVSPFTMYDFVDKVKSSKMFLPYKGTYYMPEIYKGIATCSVDDEWDEEYGKNLAYSRAKKKFLRSFFKRAQSMINDLEAGIDTIVVAFNDYGRAIDERMNKLDKQLER